MGIASAILNVICLMMLQALHLSPALATGLILVSCCPGGQVSTIHDLAWLLSDCLNLFD